MPNDNLTTKDYFNLSEDAYSNDQNLKEGWELLEQINNKQTGYAAIAIKAPNGEIIISHRGTNGLRDINDDIDLAQGEVPAQFQDADSFTKEVINEYGTEVTHTGHSLGGALAQLAAHKNGNSAVAFDPPGTAEVIQKSDLFEDEINHDQFQTLVVQNSVVSSVGTQIGNLTKIDLYDGDSNPDLKDHVMDTLHTLTKKDIFDGSTNLTMNNHKMGNIQKAFDDNGEIDSSFLSNMSTETESDFHESVENFFTPNTGQDESIEDYILQKQQELNSDGQFTPDSGFVLPDQLPETGADIDSSTVQSIAAELESNINLMYTNLEKLSSSINGI